MVVDKQVGSVDIRTNFFDKVIKQVTARQYKFKQAVSIESTSAWKNYFYRESQTTLAGQPGNTTKGIPRGAAFPQAVVNWDRVSATIEKYGMEDNIHWEDIISDDIDVQNRTLVRISEAVVKSVDDEIYNGLTENGTVVNIQTLTASAGWNQASAAIVDDLMQAKQLIAEADYDTDNLMLFINPRDERAFIKYLTDKGAQFPKLSQEKMENGRIGNLLGFDIITSRSVAASRALVVIPKRCATWKELVPLQTTTKSDEYKSVMVRAVEMGTLQLTDPKAVVYITATQIGA